MHGLIGLLLPCPLISIDLSLVKIQMKIYFRSVMS